MIIQNSCLCVLTHFVKSLTNNFVEDLGASSSSTQDMSQTQMTSGEPGKAMLSWQELSPPFFKLTHSSSKAKLELWIPLQYVHTEKKSLLPSTNCNKQVLFRPLSRITVIMFASGKSLTAQNELPTKKASSKLESTVEIASINVKGML